MTDIDYLNARVGILEETLSSLLTLMTTEESQSLIRLRMLQEIDDQATQEFSELESNKGLSSDG